MPDVTKTLETSSQQLPAMALLVIVIILFLVFMGVMAKAVRAMLMQMHKDHIEARGRSHQIWGEMNKMMWHHSETMQGLKESVDQNTTATQSLTTMIGKH